MSKAKKMTKSELQAKLATAEKLIESMATFVCQLGLQEIYKRGINGEEIHIDEIKEVINELKCPKCNPDRCRRPGGCECCGGYK